MDLTGGEKGRFRDRPAANAAPLMGLMSFALAVSACAAASNPTQTAAEPAVFVIGMPASPESTMTLTKRALGEIGGTLQAVQWHTNFAVLSTRYTANSRSAGTREIAVIASVARSVADSLMPLTLVELRAWAMDSVTMRRTINSPISSSDTRVNRPRPITLDDVEDWESVEVVMRLLLQRGGRRVR